MKAIGRFRALSVVMAVLLAASLFAGCVAEAADPGAALTASSDAELKPTDYSAVVNWMYKSAVTHAVDTFYIYPTAYLDPSEGAPTICDIDDPVMRQDAETGEYEIVDIGADAQLNVERGVVVTNADSDPITDLPEYFGPQSFHNGDYPFYFMNLQENIAKRIEAYSNR